MTPFIRLEGIAAPLPLANVDTDKICAGRFLKTVSREGLEAALFDSLRRNPNGRPRKEFILNIAPYDRASVLVVLDNFGCGSSREHAPWALLDFGIRCIIAPSFADIFYFNCIKNGILPVTLARETVDDVLKCIAEPSRATLSVDLPEQSISLVSETLSFAIDAGSKRRLLEGLDEIALTMVYEPDIQAFEAARNRFTVS
jgi:3-isopropylmalate/(R)-2-methylmalate dehydratase small subunit